jgi:hypothetical protein
MSLACRLHPRLRTYRCDAANRRFGPFTVDGVALIVIHAWTAPVGQEFFDSVLRNGSGFPCVRPVACGLRPLAMMVSMDRVLIKLPRF